MLLHITLSVAYATSGSYKRGIADDTKPRVVLDASSHSQGFSFSNHYEDKGVNRNPELLQVLIRFPPLAVAINSDIEKAFLQKRREPVRDTFLFIWGDTIPVIQKDAVEWRQCPGEDNRSDLLTRDVNARTLCVSRIWWSGPESLGQSTSEVV
ncbi:hypothetical protein HPB49_015788 [Dermacentor silvarum]|uniref:Uncharacterized protein n=1 Tax=Dermacentor silvarum TaxID=543639 RepID=A0ACB8DPW0_DERSI|nr:hypothetical protein HPB49_015788 [Dermacentor silvarum]